jgi:uncharacterized protein YjdB
MKSSTLFLLIMLLLVLSGCGGGSGSSDPIPNVALSSTAFENGSSLSSVSTESSQPSSITSNQSSSASIISSMESESSVSSFMASSAQPIVVDPISQNFTFTQIGPLELLAGDVLTNLAVGQGDGAVTYSSTNTAVAIVDSISGQVNIVGAGTAAITATKAADTKYLSATASYTIRAARINQTFTFSQLGPIKLLAGESLTNTATGQGKGAVTYRSSDTSVATVNSEGTVTLVGAGSVVITADKALDTFYLSANTSYTLYSQAIKFNQTGPVNLVVGNTLLNPAAGQGNGLVTYTSGNSNVATVASNGIVTVVGEGNTTITATIAADTNYLAAETNYNIVATLASQTLSFTQAGLIELSLDSSFTNPATGQGTGEITYRSSDNSVVTVDGSGVITAVGVGNAVITATKAADTRYRDATADYSVNVSATFTAWIGSQDTLVKFPAEMNGFEFYRSSESNCDFTNYLSCDFGQLDILSGATVTDTAVTTARAGTYLLKNGNKLSLIAIDPSTKITDISRTPNRLASSNLVNFNDHIFVIGGQSASNSDFASKVWKSKDGIRWIEVLPVPPFAGRHRAEIVVHNNKMWLIGGEGNGGIMGRTTRYFPDDIWSSSDGVNWNKEVSSVPFGGRIGHKVVIFNNKFWLIGGETFFGFTTLVGHTDVWSSEDGINWKEETASTPFGYRTGHEVLVFNNKLWLLGGLEAFSGTGVYLNAAKFNDVWSSVDGVNWIQENSNAVSPATLFTPTKAVLFNNKFWWLHGPDLNPELSTIWSSDDGITWVQETTNVKHSFNTNLLVFKDQLLLREQTGENVWSRFNNAEWRKGFSEVIQVEKP